MIHRTYQSAVTEHGPFVSWKQKVVTEVKLSDGRIFFRTTVFDASSYKCKRCRKAGYSRGRLACTGHTCETCGNPFAAFVREGRYHQDGKWVTNAGWYTSSGRLH